jgi:hypothetical protein
MTQSTWDAASPAKAAGQKTCLPAASVFSGWRSDPVVSSPHSINAVVQCLAHQTEQCGPNWSLALENQWSFGPFSRADRAMVSMLT